MAKKKGGRQRGPSGAGSVYQETIRRKRKDGTELVTTRWVAAISLPNGDRKKLIAATQKEALARLKELFVQEQEGVILTTERQTVADFLDAWLASSAERVRPTSLRAYAGIVRLYLKPALGKRELRRLQPEQVEKMMRDMRDRGLSVTRANEARRILHQALAVALRRRRVPFNAAALVEPYRLEREEHEILTPEECQRFITALCDDRQGALYLLAMATGLRQGELLGLRWDTDVDLEHSRLTVTQQIQLIPDANGVRHPTAVVPKSRKGRRNMPIPSFVVEALRRHRELQALIRDAADEQWEEHNLLFPTQHGKPQRADGFRNAWYNALKHAGLEHLRFHDLRHVYQSMLTHLGIHPYVEMELMGHAGTDVNRRYTTVYDAAKIDAADRLDALLRGAATLTAPSSDHPAMTEAINDD